jgi:hypothetical protein
MDDDAPRRICGGVFTGSVFTPDVCADGSTAGELLAHVRSGGKWQFLWSDGVWRESIETCDLDFLPCDFVTADKDLRNYRKKPT